MTVASQQYASALFDVSLKEGKLESVRHDFSEVIKAIALVENFEDFIENSKIPLEERKAVVEKTFSGTDRLLLNLLRMLTDKKRFILIDEIYEDFLTLYDENHNQARVTVESVYKLSSEELDQLGQIFIDKTGYEKLLITNEINEDLIGGVRVLIGSKVYDGSVKSQLDGIKNQFKEHTNS